MAQCISHIEKSASADWRQDGVLRNKFAEGYAMLLSLVKIRKYMPEYLHIPNIFFTSCNILYNSILQNSTYLFARTE